ncbi:uncharacterized protein LOC120429208 [Culex pipiens pallens]|uniref:uncharacterized protein LOC120429208 n=1 Tax=Culex pipiens pallens TaxID=42434 RepID=UPI0019539895|nr:uncharacterized protein LOC120429208 [Culex pipiens pallens]
MCPTRAYRQAPMQCYHCFSYGHTKARCTAETEVCRNCSKAHAISKDSDGKIICEAAASCKNWTNEDKSAHEARRLFEERKAAAESGTSYAAVTGSGNSDAKQSQNIQKELAETKQMLQKAMGELTKLKEASAVAKAAQKENEQTKRNLSKVLNELAKLKAAACKPKPSTESDQESEEESDSEMDIDPLNSKRRRPCDEESSEDAGTNNKNENNLIDLTETNGSAPVTSDEAISDPPQWTKNGKSKKIKTESGDSTMPPNNNKKDKKQ